jgi:hypothetical protein
MDLDNVISTIITTQTGKSQVNVIIDRIRSDPNNSKFHKLKITPLLNKVDGKVEKEELLRCLLTLGFESKNDEFLEISQEKIQRNLIGPNSASVPSEGVVINSTVVSSSVESNPIVDNNINASNHIDTFGKPIALGANNTIGSAFSNINSSPFTSNNLSSSLINKPSTTIASTAEKDFSDFSSFFSQKSASNKENSSLQNLPNKSAKVSKNSFAGGGGEDSRNGGGVTLADLLGLNQRQKAPQDEESNGPMSLALLSQLLKSRKKEEKSKFRRVLAPFDIFNDNPAPDHVEASEKEEKKSNFYEEAQRTELIRTVSHLNPAAKLQLQQLLQSSQENQLLSQSTDDNLCPLFSFAQLAYNFYLPHMIGNSHLSQNLNENDSKAKKYRNEKPFYLFVRDSLIDTELQAKMESCGAINHSNLATKLYILRTEGDGNCLSHSVLLSSHGIHDRQSFLRNSIGFILTAEVQSKLFQRFSQSLPREITGNNDTEEEKRREFNNLIRNIDNPRVYLESLHIFALAHVIRRPIIVYGASSVNQVQDNTIIGIYLPLHCKHICAETECPKNYHKQPLMLCINFNENSVGNGHFSALLPAYSEFPQLALIPLYSYSHSACRYEPLPLRFLLDAENTAETQRELLESYFDLQSDAQGNLHARLDVEENSQHFDNMWRQYLNKARQVFFHETKQNKWISRNSVSLDQPAEENLMGLLNGLTLLAALGGNLGSNSGRNSGNSTGALLAALAAASGNSGQNSGDSNDNINSGNDEMPAPKQGESDEAYAARLQAFFNGDFR